MATPFCAHYPAYRADGNRATAAGADRRGGGDTGKVAGNHPRPESGALRGSENNPLALCLPAYSQTGDGGICQQYPGIQLEISVYDGTVNIIEERFDLGIRFGDILEGGVVARPLMKPFREGLYASSAYLAEYGVPAMPADLHHHRLIGYRFITNNRILPLILNDHGEQLTVEMPGQLISNDIDVMADGIRHGLGIGRLFEPILQLQPDREQFIPVMEDYWKTYPPVYLYYPKNAGRTKRVKALIDFLIMHAADDAEKVGSSR